MSRQEDFIDAGIAYRMEHGKPMCIAGSNLADVERDLNRALPFEAGAEYGYQYSVEKACEWLRENIYHRVYECGDRLGYPTADFLKDFRRAMEE